MSNFKKFPLFLFIIFSANLLAQNPYQTKINSVFQNVDKSQVPTKFLMDFGVPFVPLNAFNGTLVDSVKTDITKWRMAYAALLTSYVGTSSLAVPMLNAVNTSIQKADSINNAISVPLMYHNYNDLRPDAVAAGLMTVNNEQIYDVAGRSSSPYRSQTLFIAAPSISFSNKPVTTFYFGCDVIFTNVNGQFCSTVIGPGPGPVGTSTSTGVNRLSPVAPPTYVVAVDFADGAGYRNITLGTPINQSWALTGIYRIKVKITGSNGIVMQSWFDFQVNKVPCTGCLYTAANVQKLNNSLFDANTVTGGNNTYNDGALVSYVLSKNNNTGFIKKPLIIMPGFNSTRIAPRIEQYTTISDFIFNINSFSGEYNFNRQLDDIASYDLVFVQYYNGADDIIRNADLLQSVISVINAQKPTGSFDNVIIGMSMGGLVSRYALADISKNGFRLNRSNKNSQTRLLITHDSPHRGANVPLGLQNFARRFTSAPGYVVGTVVEIITDKAIIQMLRQLGDILDAPAPNQMLLYTTDQFLGVPTGYYKANTFLANGGVYRTMVDNLPANATYQVLASSNGSQCGVSQFAPYATMLSVDAGGYLGYAGLNFGIRTNVQVNAIGTSSSVIDALRLYVRLRILGINIEADLFSFTDYLSVPLPLDGAPGGTMDLVTSSYGATPTTGNNRWQFWGYDYGIGAQSTFCFVPTASALDAKTFNAASVNGIFTNSVNTVTPSNFVGFIAQKAIVDPSNIVPTFYNGHHTEFRGRSTQWMFEQMEPSLGNNNVECSNECVNPTQPVVSGPTTLCSTATYTVPVSGNTIVQWSISDPNLASLSVGANGTVILTRQSGASGNLILYGKVSTCFIPSLNIEVGTPINFGLTGPFNPCKGSTAEYHVSPYQTDASYTWTCTNNNCGGVYPGGTGNNYCDFVLPSNPNPNFFTFTVGINRNNVCGNNIYVSQSNFRQFGTSCPSFLKVAVSPNPASNTLNLNVVDSNPTNTSNKIDPSFQVTISDLVGNVKYDNKHSTVDTQIDISSLKTGNYSLRVLKGQEVVTKTFSVVK